MEVEKNIVQAEAKPGYKKTKLGWIPEEWECGEFGNLADVIMGQSPSGESYNSGKNGVALINGPTEFTDRYPIKIQWTTSPTKICEPYDILLCVRGSSTGRLNVADDRYCIGRGVAAIRAKQNSDTKFLEYELTNAVNRILRLTSGSTFPNIDSKSLRRFPTLIPPLPEQRAVAAVLSTWDRAIDTTRQLIEKQKARQKGLMQHLLTGKKRLKGFEGGWNQVKISAIANEVRLLNKDEEDLTVLSCTKYDGLVRSLEYFGRRVYSDDLSKYKQVPPNCFAYATNHIEEGSIGFQNVLDGPGLVSPMYTVFETDNELVDDEFLFKLLKSHRMIFEYNRNMSGSINRRGGLRWKDFSSIRIKLPKKREQRAIAAILSRAENEIKRNEQYLAALQQQKKGLMQKLLTGEVRVKNSNIN